MLELITPKIATFRVELYYLNSSTLQNKYDVSKRILDHTDATINKQLEAINATRTFFTTYRSKENLIGP